MRNILLAVPIAIIIAGCVAQGSSSELTRGRLISEVLPKHETVVFSSTAIWIPDTVGYDAMLASQPTLHSGVIALSDGALTFLQWDRAENGFHILWRSPLTKIVECRIASHGRGRRLVVALLDFRTHSFELTSNGITTDASKTKDLLALIRLRIRGA